MNKILKRADDGLCPICAKLLKKIKIKKKLMTKGKLISYSSIAVIICQKHPCPKDMVKSLGIYDIAE